VATSAVREAKNGQAFVRRLRRETGLPIEIISGLDEARLIFRAVRHAMRLEEGTHLLLDVGGGSVELTLVEDGRLVWMRSVPLGVARLSERFLPSDPPTGRQVKALERHVMRTIGDLLDRARRRGITSVIGTSGTINTLVAMALAARGEEAGRLHGVSVPREAIHAIRRRVLAADGRARADLPGMDTKRVDLMPAAAVLVDSILTRVRTPELMVCGWALREGVLLELARVNGPGAAERLGFDPEEIDVIALVARGHRKTVPKPSAPELALIPPAKRKIVRGLAGLLRVADALDRTHF